MALEFIYAIISIQGADYFYREFLLPDITVDILDNNESKLIHMYEGLCEIWTSV